VTLRYDFDIAPAADAAAGGPTRDRFARLRAPRHAVATTAMFRDPETVAAILRADPVVQDYFKASGFILEAYQSGAPDGHFPARDADARAAVIERLTTNLKTHDLKGADFGGFAFGAFLKATGEAQPIDLVPQPAKTDPTPEDPTPSMPETPKIAFTSPTAISPDLRPDNPRPAPLSDEDTRSLMAARMEAQRRKGMQRLAMGGLALGLALLLYVAGQFL